MHTVNSPLGKYGQAVAAVTAILIIAAWIVAEFMRGLDLFNSQPSGLKEVALIAVGAVFGAAATINGVKAPIDAAHRRLDAINAPSVPKATDTIIETTYHAPVVPTPGVDTRRGM